jgi:hypothetical protein
MAGQTCNGVSGKQQIAQPMQAKDGTFLPWVLFPANQKYNRVKAQQQPGAQQPKPTVQMIAEF